MAICLKCGAVINDEDMKEKNHVCDDDLIPKKGEENKKTKNLVKNK